MLIYVLLDIGCLECGIDTSVLATTTDKALMLVKVNEVLQKPAEDGQAADLELWKLEHITDIPEEGSRIGLVRSLGHNTVELHAHEISER